MRKSPILLIFVLFSCNSYSQETAKELNTRGSDKYNSGDYRGAMADYSKALELNPSYESAYFHRGFNRAQMKDYTGAIADLNKAVELDPSNAVAYYIRGISKIKLGQKDSGCLDFSKAGELGHEEAYEVIREFCN